MATFKTKQEAEEKLKSMAQLGKMLEVREVKDGWGLKRKNLVEQVPAIKSTPDPVQKKKESQKPQEMSCCSLPMTREQKLREGKKICESTWWT